MDCEISAVLTNANETTPLAQLGETKFRISSKSWFLTYPKCPVGKTLAMELLKPKRPVKGMVVASEKHEDGSPHLHAFVLLKSRYDCTNCHFWDINVGDEVYHPNVQKCRNIDDVVKYIKKDGDILEFGDIDWKEKVTARQEHRRAIAKDLISGAKTLAQAIDEDPTLLFGARHLKQDLETYHQAKIQPLEASDVRGIWIYGPPGVGKSRLVRQEEKSLYLKSQNKWFDGYIGQKAILIDDFDKKGDCLSHYLKIWADRYGCTGEVKGAQVSLCHERFFITSNYHPRDIFGEDEILLEAILRRFKVIHMVDKTLGLWGNQIMDPKEPELERRWGTHEYPTQDN